MSNPRKPAASALVVVAAMALLSSWACSRAQGVVGSIKGEGGTAGAPANNVTGSSGEGGSTFKLSLPSLAVDGGGGQSGAKTSVPPPWPPKGFVNVTEVSYGAFAVSPTPLDAGKLTGAAGGVSGTGGAAGESTDRCGGLFGVLRDFKMADRPGGHPDFQRDPVTDDRGIVQETLGVDGKPIYANPNRGTTTTTRAHTFNQWYRDVPGVNMSYLIGLHFAQNGNVLTFAASYGNTGVPDASGFLPDSSYFPLDGLGFGNQGEPHNFGFTTEFHTNFIYNGGEIFTFQGDDDVFVFINNQLAIDLGGIHSQETMTVDLDAQAGKLGISKGKTYPLAVFNAERHTVESNFRVDTTMVFTDCGQVEGVPVIF